MPELPFASVIIPNYNGKPLLVPCLNAFRGQTYPADRFEVIVVDDASADGSVEFLTESYPEVRVVALAQNSGFVAACNAGVAAANGEVLVLLNNDTEAEPGWLEALVTGLMAQPEAGSAASKMLLFNRRDTLHTAGDMMGKDGIPRNRGVWEKTRGSTTRIDGCSAPAAARRPIVARRGPRPAASIRRCSCTWRTSTWPGACSCWAGSRSTSLKREFTISSAPPVAGRWPATTPAATRFGSLPAIGRGELLKRHWRPIVRAQLRIAGDALRAWRGQAARARLRGQLAGVIGLPTVVRQRKSALSRQRASIEHLKSLLQ